MTKRRALPEEMPAEEYDHACRLLSEALFAARSGDAKTARRLRKEAGDLMRSYGEEPDFYDGPSNARNRGAAPQYWSEIDFALDE